MINKIINNSCLEMIGNSRVIFDQSHYILQGIEAQGSLQKRYYITYMQRMGEASRQHSFGLVVEFNLPSYIIGHKMYDKDIPLNLEIIETKA